jgi:hypothetical protein
MSNIYRNEIVSEYYANHYRNVHYKGILEVFTRGYHRGLEKNLGRECHFSNVIEIGGAREYI